jgi:hypothetical protein
VAVESETKIEALTGVACLRHDISEFSFSDAAKKANIPDLNATPDHVMANVQVSNTS